MADLTELLQRISDGERGLEEEVYEQVYAELRRVAGRAVWAAPSGDTLQPTALVNEAYLKLLGNPAATVQWQNRLHFFNAAARAMRRILIDAARSRRAAKRDARVVSLNFDAEAERSGAEPELLIAIDTALDQLRQFDERAARVVEMRFFLGLTVEESAELLETSPKTIKRDWAFARSWLEKHLAPAPGNEQP